MAVFRSSFFGKDDMFYTGGQRIFVAHSTLNGSTDFLFGPSYYPLVPFCMGKSGT